MTTITHAPGTFCWAELATTDAEGAKRFYAPLLGWQTHDDPLPGGGVYTMLKTGDGSAGALYALTDEMKGAGVPPHWMPYVSVESAAGAAARAQELGARVLKDAFDVFDIGAMAVLQDPTGAAFSVWQPKTHHGTDLRDGQPGSIAWNELATGDVERARDFYGQMFGWRYEVQEMGSGPYTLCKKGDVQAAGMVQMTEEWGKVPPHWMVYFAVADCKGAIEQVKQLGGNVRVGPIDVPGVGSFAVVQDPQGAVCSIIQLLPRSG